MVPRSGIEPPTLRSSGACSTTELPRHISHKRKDSSMVLILKNLSNFSPSLIFFYRAQMPKKGDYSYLNNTPIAMSSGSNPSILAYPYPWEPEDNSLLHATNTTKGDLKFFY